MWTEELPKVSGFYWYCSTRGYANGGGYHEPEVVFVNAEDRTVNGDRHDFVGPLFWSERLSPPLKINTLNAH